MNIFILVVLILPRSIWAEVPNLPAFAIEDRNYRPVESSIAEITNMPPVRSQDGLNTCYGFAASALYEQLRCREAKSDCKNIDPANSPSPLYLAALSMDPMNNARDGDLEAHESVPVARGGNSWIAANRLSQLNVGYSDACYPFDQFVSKRPSDETTLKLFSELRKTFDKSITEASAPCTECLQNLQTQLKDNFDQIKTVQEIQAALKKYQDETKSVARKQKQPVNAPYFDRFVFDMFFRDCKMLSLNTDDFSAKSWPPRGSKKTKAQFKRDALEKIQELLKSGKPAAIGVCLTAPKPNKDCKDSSHEVVISGYRKICPQTGECPNPRYSFKIHNSWGAGWQKAYDDGWVDGETFLNHADYADEALTWLGTR